MEPPPAAYTPPVVTPDPDTRRPSPAITARRPPGAKLTLAKATAKALRKGLAVTVEVPAARAASR